MEETIDDSMRIAISIHSTILMSSNKPPVSALECYIMLLLPCTTSISTTQDIIKIRCVLYMAKHSTGTCFLASRGAV